MEMGYKINPLDHCVYSWKCQDNFCVLSLYVDDILLAGNSIDMIEKTKSYLGSKFEMKDMGEASYVLGIKIKIAAINSVIPDPILPYGSIPNAEKI